MLKISIYQGCGVGVVLGLMGRVGIEKLFLFSRGNNRDAGLPSGTVFSVLCADIYGAHRVGVFPVFALDASLKLSID